MFESKEVSHALFLVYNISERIKIGRKLGIYYAKLQEPISEAFLDRSRTFPKVFLKFS